MSTTDKIAYAASASITCTFGALANSATVGRCSTAIDNTSNLYDDALVTVSLESGLSVANDKTVYVYLYGSEDGSNYEEEESTAPTPDGSYTINSPTIFRGPVAIPVATASMTYNKIFSVASMFGGVMPRKWGIIVVNYSGATLQAGSATYTGITYTNG
jgi:hypothetical protein